MDILYLLIPLSLVLVFVIAVFFWWSLRSNQYEDMDGPGYRILMDDDSTGSNVAPGGPSDAVSGKAAGSQSGPKVNDI